MPDPPDVLAPIRAKAAQSLRALADKQQQLAAGWLALASKHASLGTSMLADAIESGSLKPETFLSNTAAMTIECVSSTLNLWLGIVPIPGGGDFQQIVFLADDSAETVGPVALSGASPAQFANVVCTPLTLIDGPTTLNVTQTIDQQSVMLEVGNLIVGGNPQPVGVYTGTVTLNLPPASPKLLAVITLVRTTAA